MKVTHGAETRTFRIYDEDDSLNRRASIVLIKGAKDKKWLYDSCDFEVPRKGEYSLEDWNFLSYINNFIQAQLVGLNGRNLKTKTVKKTKKSK